jgi:hypothetical protein
LKKVVQCGPSTMVRVGDGGTESVVAWHAAGSRGGDEVVVLESFRELRGSTECIFGYRGWWSKGGSRGHEALEKDCVKVSTSDQLVGGRGCGNGIFKVMEGDGAT